ncbi:protease Do-like 8, chloroplastic isoform X2 [Abrus precatorius]|uniref:Protease Do-like 8, chloroplastic isoform X2 n=1 Tax=Abrus precatorius TaxID=3816 RepID=A0A8B8LRN7_ABRPR|nr:protease Do-like 8, chloroplastic isoform X2 [Abrus precatorius]
MQLLSVCNLWSLRVPIHRNIVLSRREICFDGMSSVCSHSQHLPNDAVPPQPLISSTVEDETQDFGAMLRNIVVSPTRRVLMASLTMYSCFCSSRYLAALALGDPSVTLEEVTPPVFSSGPLFPIEDRFVQLFERNTYSVVNIFDVTLRPQLNVTGVVEIPEGNGSGVVWDEEGHIVTNYHVIGNALSRNPSSGEVVARVNILASEGIQKNFEGRLIGADRLKDLAVLKVEAPKDILRPIKVGQSLSLKVGQQCLAIGNPFGFDHTLTVGVISGLNRDISSQTGVTIGGGIQTDAAINPGNSGGPLLNSKGSLIGINTAIFTRTGTSAGVGFAIPSSTVLRIVPQLIQFGKVARAGLNVDIAPDLIANQLNVRNGALVLQVKSKADLLKALDDYNVGDKVVLMIQRGNEKLELPVVLEEQSS